MANKNIGSSFDDFLEEEGLLAEVQAVAGASVFAWELEAYIVKEKQSKSAVARSLETSRSAVDRILDPKNTSISLTTMTKMAEIMGKKLQISLV